LLRRRIQSNTRISAWRGGFRRVPNIQAGEWTLHEFASEGIAVIRLPLVDAHNASIDLPLNRGTGKARGLVDLGSGRIFDDEQIDAARGVDRFSSLAGCPQSVDVGPFNTRDPGEVVRQYDRWTIGKTEQFGQGPENGRIAPSLYLHRLTALGCRR